MCELVDAQIHNKEEHYAEERLHLGPAFDDFLVQAGAPDHLHNHHGDLEADPRLLYYVTDSELGPALLGINRRASSRATRCFFAHLSRF